MLVRDQVEAAWQLFIARLEEQLAAGWREHIERVLDERFGEIIRSAEETLTEELEARCRQMHAVLQRETADLLLQALKRLRASGAGQEWMLSLLECSGAFCAQAALLSIDGERLRCEGSRRFSPEGGGGLGETAIALASAPAILSVVESKIAAVAENSAAEISPELAGFFGGSGAVKVGLFPVVIREKTRAVLCAQEDEPGGAGSALALLVSMGALAWEARLGERAAVPCHPAPGMSEPRWMELSPEDRDVHRRARRFARVQAAEMRLYHSEAVRQGRRQGDLYSALCSQIDGAREAFRTRFVASCSSMIDYLHEELVCTLANGDASLLGPHYPGPLV